jgi:hypothetical protein
VTDSEFPACPACGAPLYGWLERALPGGERLLLRRCERCGLGALDGMTDDDVAAELAGSAREAGSGRLELRLANRRSVQAGLGGHHWAAIEARERGLYPTPEALRRLAPLAGLRVEGVRTARWGPCQRWMWQTILNSFTFNENFAREARARRLRPGAGRGRLAFAIDALVTVLAAPVVALVAFPLELIAALAGRGGELIAVATRADHEPAPRPPGGAAG